jgi:5-formyltetrahydrofolate cyclo-ligase
MPDPDAKAALRRRFLALREALEPARRAEWSAMACDHVAALCEARSIAAVAAFWPLGTEVDLRPLMDAHPSIAFHFPRIFSRNPPVLAWGPPPLGPGPWGLREPLHPPFAVPPVQLVLVPGLAFAADGHRLGYGKGFYDAALAVLPADVLTLGIGFSCQRTPVLPTGPGDVAIQGFADETGLTWIATPA